jgi:hypothetical protein
MGEEEEGTIGEKRLGEKRFTLSRMKSPFLQQSGHDGRTIACFFHTHWVGVIRSSFSTNLSHGSGSCRVSGGTLVHHL